MPAFTKEQIQNLPIDQQKTLAEYELLLARKRQALLDRANGYHGYSYVPYGSVLVIFLIAVSGVGQARLLTICCFALFALIQFHASGINRRLDALLKLSGVGAKISSSQNEPATHTQPTGAME